MAYNDHLSDYQFKYHKGQNNHQITAVHQGDSVGWLQWHSDAPSEHFKPGEITGLSVNEGHQRKGIASRMYKEASDHAPVTHSSRRTKAGENWAGKVGDSIPELKDGKHLNDIPGTPVQTYREHK